MSSMLSRLRKKKLARMQAQSKKSLKQHAASAAPEKEAPKKEAPKKAVDLSILEGSITALNADLASGDYDAHIAELVEAEKAGKNRKGALSALKERMGEKDPTPWNQLDG